MQILWNAKPAQVILNLEWLIIDKFAINNNKNSKNDIIWINKKNDEIKGKKNCLTKLHSRPVHLEKTLR